MKIKVGIPRALFFCEEFVLWKVFFSALRVKLVISEPTNDATLREGAKYLPHEFCLPVRAFVGHVISLIGRVDYVFIPRLVSLERKSYTCPKIMGLPDVVKNILRREKELKILTLNVDYNYGKLTLLRRYWRLGLNLTKNPLTALLAVTKLSNTIKKIAKAQSRKRTRFETFERLGFIPFAFDHKYLRKNSLRIGVTGFSYVLYDKYLSFDLLNKLNQMGIEAVTAEMLPLSTIEEGLKELPKLMPWHLSRRIYGAAVYFLKEKEYDGLINLSYAGCGPSSKVDKLIELRAKEKRSNPLLHLHLNQHLHEETFGSKLEDFINSLKIKRV